MKVSKIRKGSYIIENVPIGNDRNTKVYLNDSELEVLYNELKKEINGRARILL